jgi:hypothetical protein
MSAGQIHHLDWAKAHTTEKEKTMKTFGKLVLIAVFMLTLPLAVSAMDHSKMDMDHKDHGSMNHDHSKMDHSKMDHSNMAGEMVMLGSVEEDGVNAMGHIMAYDAEKIAAMEKMGMSATHHFMVYFKDVKSGKAVTDGTVALKVKAGDKESEATRLMLMGEGFGADINVPAGEKAELKVGSKLVDGKKRTFEFEMK